MSKPDRIPVRIREKSWLARLAARRLGAGRLAMVFGHTIHLYNVSIQDFFGRPSWVMHELKHVEQYERLGLTRFLWEYLQESRRVGYFANRFEAEARAAEGDRDLLRRYDLSAYNPPF